MAERRTNEHNPQSGRIHTVENLLADLETTSVTLKKKIHKTRTLLAREFVDWVTLDMIIILGASMDFSKANSRWILGGLVSSDASQVQVVGGFSRVVATKQIRSEGFNGLFAVTGGTQVDPDGEKTSRANIMAQAIVRGGKEGNDTVIPIGKEGNGNTLGNIQDTIDFIEGNRELLTERRIGLLTNAWHLPRSLFFFLANPYFETHGIEIRPINADSIVRRRSPLHGKWVDAFNNQPLMQERLGLERQGILAFINKTYEPLSS